MSRRKTAVKGTLHVAVERFRLEVPGRCDGVRKLVFVAFAPLRRWRRLPRVFDRIPGAPVVGAAGDDLDVDGRRQKPRAFFLV